MKSFSSARGRFTILGIMVVMSLSGGLFPPFVASAQPEARPSAEPAPAPTPPQANVKPPSAESLEASRATASRIPVPKKGCFKCSYPSTEWQEVPCTTGPTVPYPPAPEIVGNYFDLTAKVSGSISSAVGSFDSVTGVTSETGNVNGQPPVANFFSLQLNTNQFDTALCTGVTNCKGWQQFGFSNTRCDNGNQTPCVFIQYWLLNYGPTCPSAQWLKDSQRPNDCYISSPAVGVSPQTITQLGQLRLTGMTNSGTDTAIISTGGGALMATGQDSLLNLANNWQVAEFNVFGDCCGSQANFNNGSTLVVRTSVDNGTSNAPLCFATGFTGETNNLNLVFPCCPIGGSSPAIKFTESNAAAVTSTCGLCAAVGERCFGTGDCCSGSCSGGTCQCLPLGSTCSRPGVCCGGRRGSSTNVPSCRVRTGQARLARALFTGRPRPATAVACRESPATRNGTVAEMAGVADLSVI